jgi:hypothetical protein
LEILPATADGMIPVDRSRFDHAVVSAVIEHVGSYASQVKFIAEWARVAGQTLFVTTPNRGHWLEFHTKLPLLHWLPKPLHRRLLRLFGARAWAEESHLNLLTGRELLQAASAACGAEFDLSLHRIRALGMTSNLVLIGRRK